MGVPKFYRWISERYPCLSQIVKQAQIPEFDNFYLDMNGIIHTCSHPNDDDPHFRITEDKIFDDILHYIEFLFQMIKPRKVFFMAVDGVAPRAKMNQQRARRFRTAKDVEMQEKKAKDRGEVLPQEARFDSNCITPGTKFMARLQEQLKYFVVMKISTDKMWRDVKVYLSGHETPGEGEHKIMDFIRYERSQPAYDPNTRHCLYGLDADLIMLGLSTHEPHLSVLREEVVFGWKHPKRARIIPEHTTFHLLHLSLMREYLDFEFSALKSELPFPYNLENIIDDWILMGFLVGNDFIPNLPYMHIQKDALQTLYKIYIEVMPSMDGYLNEGGTLHLERFEKYLNYLSKYDYEKFNDTYADLKYWEAKTGRKPGNEEKEETGKKECRDFLSSLSQLDDGIDYLSLDDDDGDEEELFALEFSQHKRNYYMNKLEYENVTEEVLKEQADCYVRAIQWNLHYYYNGVMSWSWFYPHHYAPYISDIKGFNNLVLNFDKGQPFLPFQQLLSVLPEACKKLLPKPYQQLMTDPKSPLKRFYPDDFETDLNGKTQEWEAVVLIPFINEQLLVKSTVDVDSSLTAEEKGRNKHGPHLLYTYTEEDLDDTYKSSLPDHFRDIDNHAKCEEIDENFFRLPIEKIKKGLLENTKIGVYYSGFPTFRHIKFTVELKNESIRVFQNVSSGANMMITVQDENEKDLKELGQKLVGKTAFVRWPHLVEALIGEITDGEQRFYLYTSKSTKKTSLMMAELTDNEKNLWKKETETIIERHYERYGINTGEINFMVRARTLTGRKYVCTADSKIVLERQWSFRSENFPLQTIVKDIDVHLSPLKEPETVEELYPVGTCCFMLGHPYYGSMGEVTECMPHENKGRLRVNLHIPPEPMLNEIMKNEKSISNHYMPGYLVARHLGISSFLFSCMSGTFLVQTTNPESMSVNKVNIGLNLKFNTKNEEIPGYSKRVEDGTWLYSDKTLEVMENYLKEFPELFEKLVTLNDLNGVHITQLFSNEDEGKKTLKKITSWLKAQPCSEIDRKSCNAKFLDDAVVKVIEYTIDSHKKSSLKLSKKWTKISVKPNLLFCPSDIYGISPPDANATYRLYDRVVSVQANHTVPLGYRGTVIGIEEAEKTDETVYTVVFDDEFPGGLALYGSRLSGYKMRSFDLINISYGQRSSPGGQETFLKEPYASRNIHGKSYDEVASNVDQDQGIKHNEEGQNKHEQSKQKNWSYKQKNLPPRLQILPRNSPLKRMVPELPQKHSKTEGAQTPPIFYNAKSISPYQQLNHSPHSPFILQEKELHQENQMCGKMDMQQNFVTPKIMPACVPQRIISRPNYQNANLSPQTSLSDVNNMEFETLWKGLQQSRDTYPSPQRDLSQTTPAYGRQVSVEELFQGAINAKVSPTPSNHEESQSENTVQANQYENSAIKELNNISIKLWNKPPDYKELTAGPMSTCQAEVVLPNGRRFNSIVSPNRQKAKESAAEQALACLKSISHQQKVLWQPQHQIPVLTQRLTSGPRPMLPIVEGQYFYPSNYSVPPFPAHSIRNDVFVLRHPPPPAAALIPESFVESNRETLSNLDIPSNFNTAAILHPKREQDSSYSHRNECNQNVSPGRRKEQIDLENKKEQIESQKESSAENMFVPMQVTKKQSAIKKSLEPRSTTQLVEKSTTQEKSSEAMHAENPESTAETKKSAKQKKRQRKSRLAVKFDGCNS